MKIATFNANSIRSRLFIILDWLKSEKPDLLSVQETKVQDAVYYKTRVQIEPAGRDVKPGMTANVTVMTRESKGVLVIPIRAVRTKEGTDRKIVRVLEGATPREATVELGLRGDEGRVEVTKGLNEGQTVILSEKTK